jgi:propionyl-CoA carboxylase alpha chain
VGLFDAGKFLNERLSELVVTLRDHSDITVTAKDYARDSNGVATATVTLNEGSVKSESFTVSTDYAKGELLFKVTIRGVTTRVQIVSTREQQSEMVLQYKGTIFKLALRSKQEQELFRHMPVPQEVDTARFVVSPMPGSVYSIRVQVGDKVVAGQEVCVVEAMKMQNAIRVVKAGVIKAIHVKVAQTVASEDLLVEVDPL